MSTRSVPYGTLIGAGVDYISVSAASGVRERSLVRIGEKLLIEAISNGGNERSFSAWGYDGTKVGPISLGSGARGTILRVSGASASRISADIIRASDNVSRVDFQATARFSRDVSGLGRAHDREFQRVNRQRVRPLHARVIVTHGRGDTLDVGSRSSQYRGRIYDKFRQSHDPSFRRCWRYEIECKSDAAQKAARFIIEHDNDPEAIAASVDSWFRARGITPRYRPTVAGVIDPVGAVDSDAARSLRWLGRGVRPVVKRLASVYGINAVLAVLVDDRDPGTVLPLRPEREEDLAAYDAWTIARQDDAD